LLVDLFESYDDARTCEHKMFIDGRLDKMKDSDRNLSGNALVGRSGAGLEYQTGSVRINITLRRVSVTIVAVEKQYVLHVPIVSVALVIHHAKPMGRIQLPVTSLALPHFSTLSHKRHDFRENFTGNKMCVLIFSTTFVRNISHFEKN